MKQTHYLRTTVQKGNRIDISLPSLPEGQTIEIILIVPETLTNQSINRQAFRQLPIEERRRILTQQAGTNIPDIAIYQWERIRF